MIAFVSNCRKPIHNNDLMNEEFKPIQRSSKPDEFNFVDVRNDGIFPGKAPSNNRTRFMDHIINEIKRLVESHGDTPKKTPIEQQCTAMRPKITSKLKKCCKKHIENILKIC